MSKQSALDKFLNKEHKVLDQGSVRLVDLMGDDEAIVQAARVSYGKGTKKVSEDRGLIRYLVKHEHTSPLEQCEIKIHCVLPIFIARQMVRHRTAQLNEYSLRFSEANNNFYVPSPELVSGQDPKNKQSRGTELPEPVRLEAIESLREGNQQQFTRYQKMIESGVARELARIALPVANYTSWYWKINLWNLLHFLKLRLSPHAQFEIRVYAEAIAEIVKEWVPFTWEAFEDYRLKSCSFSRIEIDILRDFARDYRSALQTLIEGSGLSQKESRELLDKLT